MICPSYSQNLCQTKCHKGFNWNVILLFFRIIYNYIKQFDILPPIIKDFEKVNGIINWFLILYTQLVCDLIVAFLEFFLDKKSLICVSSFSRFCRHLQEIADVRLTSQIKQVASLWLKSKQNLCFIRKWI